MSTLVVYPDSGTWWTTIDWYVKRWTVNETFTNIQSGSGSSSSTIWCVAVCWLEWASTTNQYSNLWRNISTFDTSSLTSSASISDVKISYWKYHSVVFFYVNRTLLGSPDCHFASATPASNNALVAWDYTQCGTTSFGSITAAAYASAWDAYLDTTLNSSWISNVSKTGISKFSMRTSWDIYNTTTGITWRSWYWSWFEWYSSRAYWTTNDPKLTITYTTVVWPANLKSINWLAKTDVKSVNWLAMASIKSFNWVT